jgi:5-methylcytosine-specific restriction endonuclease McrA
VSYVPKQLKSNAMFCSRECKTKHHNRTKQDAIDAAKPAERICPYCGRVLPRTMRVDATFCSQSCNEKAHALQRKLRARTGSDEKPGYLRAEVCKRDKWTCGICGERVNPSLEHPHPRAASLDHVIPVSQGGGNEPANLRLTHLVCNLRRRNLGGNEQLAII